MTNWQNNPANPALQVPVRDDEELVQDNQVASPVLPLDSDEVAALAETTDDENQLEKLGRGKSRYDGDFILQGQETGKEFSHVSKIWLDQCISYDEGMSLLANQQSNILDLRSSLREWESVVTDDDRFAMRYRKTGRDYFPTKHCLQNMAVAGKGSCWVLSDLLSDKQHATKEDEVVFTRDRRDAEVMKAYVDLLLFQDDRMPQEKVRLFRTWDHDSTLRAFLSKDYTVINNAWFLETVMKLVPGGMLSHWRGDADTIYGNVLIPDTIREEDDSDYGGMLSIGNSEIGIRRLSSVPSVFRAICMNGCIWDQELGKGINDIHRRKDGKVDLGALAAKIKTNLEKQIPLLDSGILTLLATRNLTFSGVPAANVLAAVCNKFRVSRKQARGVFQSYQVEKNILHSDELANTAFAVLNAFTRYGQTADAVTWVSMDTLAGKITKFTDKQWTALVRTAESVDDKELEKLFG